MLILLCSSVLVLVVYSVWFEKLCGDVNRFVVCVGLMVCSVWVCMLMCLMLLSVSLLRFSVLMKLCSVDV